MSRVRPAGGRPQRGARAKRALGAAAGPRRRGPRGMHSGPRYPPGVIRVLLTGMSGTGKSTMIRLLAGRGIQGSGYR